MNFCKFRAIKHSLIYIQLQASTKCNWHWPKSWIVSGSIWKQTLQANSRVLVVIFCMKSSELLVSRMQSHQPAGFWFENQSVLMDLSLLPLHWLSKTLTWYWVVLGFQKLTSINRKHRSDRTHDRSNYHDSKVQGLGPLFSNYWFKPTSFWYENSKTVKQFLS